MTLEVFCMLEKVKVTDLFCDYYEKWIEVYKKGVIRKVTMDFHHQLKGAILDAVDEGLIERDPTRKAIIKGKAPTEKKIKYLKQFELHTLLTVLDLKAEVNWDWFILLVAKTGMRFSELLKGLPEDEPIFVEGKIYNSTVNDVLERHCKKANVPVISIHGLRHTHASLLLFAGVSIASVARRLGHASMTTTQKTYLHIIQELENTDVDLVMRSLSGLN